MPSRLRLLSFLLALLSTLAAFPALADQDPLTSAKGKKAVVLFFITNDCPICNAYAPEIQRICTRYVPKKVAFYLIYADPDLTRADAKKHAQEYGYTFPLLLDRSHRWVRQTGATVTPEAAVLAPNGRLLYRGRIDDLYVDYGKRRCTATRHDLCLALDAIVQGKPIPHLFTKAIGCYIPETR